MVSLSNNTQGNVNISTRNGAGVNLTSNNDTDVNANMNGNAQRAKSWAVGEGLIDGVDYSAKYYAQDAKESKEIAERSIQSEGNAQIWAEGTDEEVQTLGGEHSSKGWVDYVMENAPTAEIEQTETGATITVTDIHGTTTADILNGAKGDKGDTGAQGEQGIQGAKGDKGDKGDTGASGAAATISVGTVTTGAAGTNASITNSGTSSAAVFDFTIPKGDKGEQGIQGIQGEQGIQGIQGEKGDKGDTGATGLTGATGNGVYSVVKESTIGLEDTYRMTFTDGTYFDYTVTNGENGTGSVADVQVNGVSVLTDNVANIDLTNYVTTDTVQNITAEKTFVGNKLLKFKGANSSSKLGFTAYDSSNREVGYLECQGQGNASHKCRLGVYDTNTSNYDNVLGFEYYKAKGSDGVLHRYNLLCPPLYPSTTDASYYIPMAITDGNTTVTADNTGSVDISSLLPDVSGYATQTWVQNQNYLTSSDLTDYVTNTSLATTLADYVTNSALTTTLSDYALLSDIPDISTKQDTLVSGTNIKTINSTSLLGSGNISVLQNTATGSNSLTILGTATTYQNATNIGTEATASGTNATAIGCSADALGWISTAIGYNSYALGDSSTAIGALAYASADYAIQLGDGRNTTAKSLQIGFGTYNYTLLNGTTGLIPDARISSNIARISDVADTDLSNLSTTGQAVIDAKVDDDDYYYKSGDTATNLEYFTGGLLTAGGTEIDFCIYLPKSMAKITTVTCTALLTGFRKSNGSYMPSGGNGWNALANGSVTLFKYSDNMIRVAVTYSNYGGTNNTPVGVYASISLSFT